MSLYYEAAAVLANPDRKGGSLKSRIYNQKELKSSPAQIVALVTESAKWSIVLKDVIERSAFLADEKKVCRKNLPRRRIAAYFTSAHSSSRTSPCA